MEWKSIKTAPTGDRILVAGWQPERGLTRGYWWWHEDIAWDGKATEHPEATLWCPIIKPDFPPPPKGE